MAARLSALPDGYGVCSWCGHASRAVAEEEPGRCPNCGLHSQTPKPKRGVRKSTSVGEAPKVSKSRRSAERVTPFNTVELGQPILGVDPGARYTGIVIRDGDVPLYSATLVRDKDASAHDWSRQVIRFLKDLLVEYGNMPVAVEGVSDPKGFKHGERASINPGHIMRAAVVFGAVSAVWEDAIVVPPGGNGSQHQSHYPPALVGRRPKDLPGSNTGAGTRAHEQSAWDVAGKGAKIAYPTKPEPLTFS